MTTLAIQAPRQTAAALLLDGITKTYRSKAGSVQALRGVTHAFAPGTFTAVMGASGSGKSTLLQCAAGLDRPTSGSVLLAGTDLTTLDETGLTKLRRQAMGFIFQAYNLLPALTVHENVALPLRLIGTKPSKSQVYDVLARVGLDGKAKRRPAELSGGQQQRVAIARALVNDPLIILADEPTGNLDSSSGAEILGILDELNRQGKTLIMVTHDNNVAERAGRAIRLRDGQVESDVRR